MQGGVESIGEFVVSGGDVPELLEAIEESLNEASCFVTMPVDLTRRVLVEIPFMCFFYGFG